MKLLRRLALLTLALLGTGAFAQASYDSDKNEVVIKTPLLAGIDTGFIRIKAEDHITIVAVGLDPRTKKLVCPRRPNFDPPCRLNFDPGLVAGIA